MSSPTTTPKRTPTRTPKRTPKTTPKRGPLQERSPSQKNEAAGRLQKDSKPELTDTNIFTATPFPTKPQHVLLPSTIRKQRSRQNVENELPTLFFNRSQPDVSVVRSQSQRRQDARRARRAPNLQLKQSVTALRDMYEAHAESSRPSTAIPSRPSTAAPSPALRPTGAKLRSMSSSEGLSGRNAWEMLGLPKVSADDLSMLPTLPENLRNLNSESSFASRVSNQGVSSSPNFRTFEDTSPNLPTFHDFAMSSDPIERSSTSEPRMVGRSSPNVVQLHHSSSMMTTDPTPTSMNFDEAESSPNFVQLQHSSSISTIDPTPSSADPDLGESSPNIIKLGTSSPKRSNSPTPSQASTVSRKRKRPETAGSSYAGRTPLFFGRRRERARSSPPTDGVPASSEDSLQSSVQRVLPSSPPELASARSHSQPTSSPVIRVHGGRFSSDRSSIASAHTNLQSILSSSPGPPVHRPIVRAPDVNQFEIMAMQKRQASGQSTAQGEAVPRLSPVPSVTSVENVEVQQLSSSDLQQFPPSRSASRVSVFSEDLHDILDAESIAPAQVYMMQHDLNSSQVNMISDDDRHEAADELRALPRQHSSFAAALSQARSASYLGSSSSSNSLSRIDSVRTSMEERLQSMRSYRPGSSGSYRCSNVLPTWARRYYSGFYEDSFQYLYGSRNHLTVPVTYLQPPSRRASIPGSLANSSSYETITTKSSLRRSWSRSVRSSLNRFIPSVVLSSQRPRLDVRKSHTTAGIGPLVSNPVRPVSEMVSRPSSAYRNRQTIRRVSMPLSAVDPRYHWNGITEDPNSPEETQRLSSPRAPLSPQHSERANPPIPMRKSSRRFAPPLRLMRLPTPHLHHDRRLHTGSTISQGFGAPYNTRPQWQPAVSDTDQLGPPSWFKVDVRESQVICFISGFLFPPMWFAGAALPLPDRPSSYHDIEKSVVNHSADWSEQDIVARLRLEKHIRGLEEIKWQNARWWRRMNRWMCCVGLVILAAVIVLAVIGTRNRWT